jgi:hypothetical protein
MEWNELRDKVLSLRALEHKMEQLQKSVREAETEVATLRREHGKEMLSVVRLEEKSFSAFMLKLVGKHKTRLEKEQQDEIKAKLAYDKALTNFEVLEKERVSLEERISELKKYKIEYDKELKRRREELNAYTSYKSSLWQFSEIIREHKGLVSQITEIEEANTAATRVISTAKKALKSLDNAENWSQFNDFAKGGLITPGAKYTHMDDAERYFNRLSSQLIELKQELGDIHNTDGLNFKKDFSYDRRAVDFWNIYSDYTMRSKLHESTAQVKKIQSKTEQIQNELTRKLSELKDALQKNIQAEEDFISNLE